LLQHQTSISPTEYAPALLARYARHTFGSLKSAARKLNLDYWLLMSDYDTDVLPYLDDAARAERSRRLRGEQ
jgi:hypothetical protein